MSKNMKITEIVKDSKKLGKEKAGSFSFFKNLIAYGDYDGEINLLSYPSLEKICSVKLFSNSCDGVQISDDKIICLGTEVSQSLSKPSDWKATLKILNQECKLEKTIDLRAGNWNMVKNNFQNSVILYDSSEDQGAVCFDVNSGEKIWELHSGSFIRANLYDEELFLMSHGQELFILNKNNGQLKFNKKLPDIDGIEWNSAIPFQGHILLGGNKKTKVFLVDWDPVNDSAERLWKSKISDIFSEEIIMNSEDDEDCGYDLSNVSNLIWLSNKKLALIIGGDGERLGVCTSASAIGITEMSKNIHFKFKLINPLEGNSGVGLVTNNKLLVDCGGTLKLLEVL